MKIAILGAMIEEIEPLLALYEHETVEFGGNKFYLAKHKNHELIIAYSKIGKVNSALTAAVMTLKFGAEILLFTGVAGAVNESLKIGDLVYATKAAQHDLDISAFGHPLGFVPGGKVFVESDAKLNKIALEVAANLGVNLRPAVIASGDQFICDEAKKSWIKENFSADIVEMEGASVAVACDSLGIPFFILRSISDSAGEKAEFDFDEFLVESAKISLNFISNLVEKL